VCVLARTPRKNPHTSLASAATRRSPKEWKILKSTNTANSEKRKISLAAFALIFLRWCLFIFYEKHTFYKVSHFSLVNIPQKYTFLSL
jgi:hypothetical protein